MSPERPPVLAARPRALGFARIRQVLPQGGSLPIEDWRRRHAGIMVLLWLNGVAIPTYGLVQGRTLVHNRDSGAALAVLAALGRLPGSRASSARPPPRSACSPRRHC